MRRLHCSRRDQPERSEVSTSIFGTAGFFANSVASCNSCGYVSLTKNLETYLPAILSAYSGCKDWRFRCANGWELTKAMSYTSVYRSEAEAPLLAVAVKSKKRKGDSQTLKQFKSDPRVQALICEATKGKIRQQAESNTGEDLADLQSVVFDYIGSLHLDYQNFDEQQRPAVIKAASKLSSLEGQLAALAWESDEDLIRSVLQDAEELVLAVLNGFELDCLTSSIL